MRRPQRPDSSRCCQPGNPILLPINLPGSGAITATGIGNGIVKHIATIFVRSAAAMGDWGIRGRLSAAFAVIAAMAILISIGAGLADSPQLSAQSASLAARGPALPVAQNRDGLQERSRKMQQIQHAAEQKLGELIELGADRSPISALGETIKHINDTTASLVSASRERLDIAAQHDKLYAMLRAAQTAFFGATTPAMMQLQPKLDTILATSELSASDAVEASPRSSRSAT